MTEKDCRVIRLIKNQAAERNVDSATYFKAMLAALHDGREKYPDDTQKVHEYTSMILNEKYPVCKEAVS